MILIVMAVALSAGVLWARYKSQGELCTTVEVQVINADSTSFVTPQGVLSDLEHQGLNFKGKPMSQINASSIEEALSKSPYLEFADIVKCQNGRLLIRVSQLLPVLRVFDGDNSYYVNRAGKHMDASLYYHSDVPVVQGHFTSKYPATRLLPLIDYVSSDSLLNSLVTMYCMRDTNNIIIVPQISGHVINMGNATDFENKFAKLKLFYREVMPKRGWDAFDTISVKWDHQIVATRRVKAITKTIDYDPDDDEQAPDIQTMDMTLKSQPESGDKNKQDDSPDAGTTASSTDNKKPDNGSNKKNN